MKIHNFALGIYILVLLIFTIFSWGFVDANFFRTIPFLYDLAYHKRLIATLIYGGCIGVMFSSYCFLLHAASKSKISSSFVWKMIFLTGGVLLFSFPAISNDVFNYIATAKVTFFYKENPYIVMPIEIPNEPMLTFMHASNKVALYGPFWILLAGIPYAFSFNSTLLAVFIFKSFIALFYVGLSFLIWTMSKKRLFSLIFFSLNPLVVIETFVSIHNDVVMMFLALLSFFFLQKRRYIISTSLMLCSILIKYATLFLLPVYIYVVWKTYKNQKIVWRHIWLYAAMAMASIFFLSPLREELYSWYFIWPLTFISMVQISTTLSAVVIAFSFGLLLRIMPFLYTREWGGLTPIVKKLVSAAPPGIILLYYAWKKRL